MATYTIEQARAYYNTLPPEEKAKVDGIGGPSVEWLTNAVNAGVPDALAAVGGKKGAAEGGWEEEGGYTLPWEDAAEPEEGWANVHRLRASCGSTPGGRAGR